MARSFGDSCSRLLTLTLHFLAIFPYYTGSLATAAASPNCTCGYRVSSSGSPTNETHIYTQAFETDFLHLASSSSSHTSLTASGWRAQEYTVTPAEARGPFGKAASTLNVLVNPLAKPGKNMWDGPGKLGGRTAGLELWVRSKLVAGGKGQGEGEGEGEMLVGMGEVASVRDDMWYGSYRVGMQMSRVSGTCGAFFWFRDDAQEIDTELLSAQYLNTTLTNTTTPGLINLVLQSPASAAANFNAAGTASFSFHPLPFNPSEAPHEYRFDWSPGLVSFYADGVWLKDITANVPEKPGRLVLNHWSNGDPLWSAGPPVEDAVMTVRYVKAYFNTEAEEGMKPGCEETAVCEVPEQVGPPTGETFFFSQGAKTSAGMQVVGMGVWEVLAVVAFVVAFLL